MNQPNYLDFGVYVRDTVTGLEGLILARSEGLYDALQYRVHPCALTADGQPQPAVWLDSGRLEVTSRPVKRAGFIKETTE